MTLQGHFKLMIFVLSERPYMPLPIIGRWQTWLYLAVSEITTYSLKFSIENCGQTAADGNMITSGVFRIWQRGAMASAQSASL